MDSAVWGMIGTLAGAVVGAAASIGATWRASAVSYRMHNDKQQEERREKAKEFQRATLLDLQDALYDAVRMCGRAYFADFVAYRSGGEWGKGRLSEDLSAGLLASSRRVSILIERVENTELRSEVKSLTAQMSALTMQTEKEEADCLKIEIAQKFDVLVERIGTVLRSYY